MAFSVNKCFFVGSLGRDAEIKFTQGGKQVANFSIATERSWKAQGATDWTKETTWVNVILWGSEKTAAQLVKGAKVHVEGRLATRNYEDKDGKKVYVTEIVADNVIVFNGHTSGAAQGAYDGGDDSDPF